MSKIKDTQGLSWEHWYFELEKLAQSHGVSVADEDAWYPEWEQQKSVEDALYSEYPEHKPSACVHKQHDRPCIECPWRKASAPGWLGAAEPGEFLALAHSNERMPCHLAVNYESSNWKAQAEKAPQCAGRAIFLANQLKLPTGDILRLKADPETVFNRPHEFIAHHAHLPAESLQATLIWDLYTITKQPRPPKVSAKGETTKRKVKKPVTA